MLAKILNMLKVNPVIHLLTNTFLLGNFYWIRGKRNRIEGFLRGLMVRSSIQIYGHGNRIRIAKGAKLEKVKIYIHGHGNEIIIGENCSLYNTSLWMTWDWHKIHFGNNTTANNAELAVQDHEGFIDIKDGALLGGFVSLGLFRRSHTENIGIYAFEGTNITIGEKTCVSDGTVMRSSDSHAIYEKNGTRVNPAKDITIGKKVWICSGTMFLKGAAVGDNAVVGTGSLVTKDFSEYKNVLIAGTPARVIKEDISWVKPVKERRKNEKNIVCDQYNGPRRRRNDNDDNDGGIR